MSQTIVVTGASRGIGLGLVKAMVSRRHAVIGTVRKDGDAAAVREAGASVEVVDVGDEGSIKALGARLGGRGIDVLVNNAGMSVSSATMADVDAEAMVRVFRVNAVGPLLVTRALLGNLRAGGRRVVVNISSVMGSIGADAGPGSYIYRTSKTALNMVNRCLGKELAGEGFCCVVMHPGWVRTDMGGSEAPLSVEESAAGLAGVIEGLGAKDNGRFLDHAGRGLPW
ncbi:MAG: SDR family oxidoreductase [Phycisphaerales bacterium]